MMRLMFPPMMDPSKMDPKVLMELSQLIQRLPPDQLSRIQTINHNMMAGMDVSREMMELERFLPPEFREKIASLMGGMVRAQTQAQSTPQAEASFVPHSSGEEMDLKSARLTVLRGVAEGRVSPEEAVSLLFSESTSSS